MSTTTPQNCLTAGEGYRLWARTYDHETNPMLALERRVLEPLLPAVAGLDIFDLGCGTGRWLEALKDAGAHSLTGIDASPEMLAVAKSKLAGAAKLLLADGVDASLPAASADLVLCSFVLSYLEDAGPLFKTVKLLLRPGGSLFLTDVHPETAAAMNWRRGVRTNNGFQEIQTYQRTFNEVISLCQEADFAVTVCLEPRFGEEERAIFEQKGKGEYFDSVAQFPAIYILQLTAAKRSIHHNWQESESGLVSRIAGPRFALDAETSCEGEMRIGESRIESLHGGKRHGLVPHDSQNTLDLQGFLVFPGLINAHDHLEFALFPRLGKCGYNNFLEWAEDIHHPGASPVTEHRQVPRHVRLWWGGIRNLLCGATTVCHHNPYEPEVFSDEFIVRVLREFGWAHSLAFDPDFCAKKKKTPKGEPFLIHLAEGTDRRSAEEVFQLSRSGALDADTVIIHGLGMNAKGKAAIRAACAGLIWCPSSNIFLFGKTLPSNEIRSFPKVALGSDSPLTAHGDLLDEVRYAHEFLQTPPADLYAYVTLEPARLLHLKNGEGRIRPGATADLIAVRDRGLTPSETLAGLSYKEVELVLLGGRVQLASTEMLQRLPSSVRKGLKCLSVEGTARWVRAPMDRLFAEAKAHLGNQLLLGGKEVRLAMES
jgi:cytosine/adenosine deaminase-related metal-dependent hydrolase/SAM-dependent methyltransferase